MAHYSTEVDEIPPVSVLVAGGGIAGVYSALAAARSGVATILVEQHGFVGGQATAGGVHTFCGETRIVNNAWREMVDRLRAASAIAEYRPNDDGRQFDSEALKFVLQEMLIEAGVRVLLHTNAVDVQRVDDRVDAVILVNKDGLTRVQCSIAIDATGDADLVARGGWAFDKGGPVLTPTDDRPEVDPKAQPKQLPMSLYFHLIDTGRPVRAVLPHGCPSWDQETDLPMTTVIPGANHITVKMKVIGFDATDAASLSDAEHAARRQMMGLVYHLQTVGYRGTQYPTYRLGWVAPHIGVREGRRVVGRSPLTVDDVLAGRRRSNAIAVGSYHADYHWPNRVQRAGTGVTTQVPPYHIPFAAMLPVGSDNLLVPGRCMSGEQMAMSSFRVMGTCAQTGFAAGTAAALAAELKCTVGTVPMETVRHRLRASGVRLDLAPYGTYLRGRRDFAETAVPSVSGYVEDVSIAQMPDNSVCLAWSERESRTSGSRVVRAALRADELWAAATVVAADASSPRVRLYHCEPQRLFAEYAQLPTAPPQEGDSRPGLYLDNGVSGKYIATAAEHDSTTFEAVMPSNHNVLCTPIPTTAGHVLSCGIDSAGRLRLLGRTTDAEQLCPVGEPVGRGPATAGGDSSEMTAALFESDGAIGVILERTGSARASRFLWDGPDRGAGGVPRVDTVELPGSYGTVLAIMPSPGDGSYCDGALSSLVWLGFESESSDSAESLSHIVAAISDDGGESWHRYGRVDSAPRGTAPIAAAACAAGVLCAYPSGSSGIVYATFSREQITHEPTRTDAAAVEEHHQDDREVLRSLYRV